MTFTHLIYLVFFATSQYERSLQQVLQKDVVTPHKKNLCIIYMLYFFLQDYDYEKKKLLATRGGHL